MLKLHGANISCRFILDDDKASENICTDSIQDEICA